MSGIGPGKTERNMKKASIKERAKAAVKAQREAKRAAAMFSAPAMALHVNRISVRHTIPELQDTIRRFGPDILSRRRAPMHLTVDGYDLDPRELHEIPEVIELYKRVIESGLISLLAVNLGDDRVPGLLGSGDIYLAVNGLIQKRDGRYHLCFSRSDLDAFRGQLEKWNAVCDAALGTN